MLWEPRDAEDATQEILVKIVTRLDSFRGESAFRTWAYRVAANHLLSMCRGRTEQVIGGFECYAGALDRTPEEDAPEDRALSAEDALLAEEARIGCTRGMLLCLDREQRLAFVLAEILELPDVEAAGILGLSHDAFRQRLSRARHQLSEFLRGRCGLVDGANPCRCARKTRGFVRAGIVDPASLRFTDAHRVAVERVAPARARALGAGLDETLRSIYRDGAPPHPHDFVAAVAGLLAPPR
jgi:RNA polymerase sigma factor (sigma-70 family)